MSDERRSIPRSDRRAHSRTGRRTSDGATPWYRRRRVWLATGSLLFIGWKRVRRALRATREHTGAGA